jgi:hypothetical protein
MIFLFTIFPFCTLEPGSTSERDPQARGNIFKHSGPPPDMTAKQPTAREQSGWMTGERR